MSLSSLDVRCVRFNSAYALVDIFEWPALERRDLYHNKRTARAKMISYSPQRGRMTVAQPRHVGAVLQEANPSDESLR